MISSLSESFYSLQMCVLMSSIVHHLRPALVQQLHSHPSSQREADLMRGNSVIADVRLRAKKKKHVAAYLPIQLKHSDDGTKIDITCSFVFANLFFIFAASKG